jgi:ParB family chromosome partitioning protein
MPGSYSLCAMAARRARRVKSDPGSKGLTPAEVASGAPPADLRALERRIDEAGGAVLARYRDPWGGAWLALAALPLARVAPTPFQRDLSEPHAKRLADVIERLGSFLDPIIAVPAPDGGFWTPNGYHRLSALRALGARAVSALVSPDPALAYRILALNTEKAHNLRERALEAVRMARGLAEADPSMPESAYGLELEEASLVTLGFAYEKQPRFAGGAYAPALRASDAFADAPLAEMLELREARAERLLALDARVAEIIEALRARGFESPYLRNFVVARLRPFRPPGSKTPPPEVEDLLDAMEKAAERFDPAKIRPEQVARTGGAAE